MTQRAIIPLDRLLLLFDCVLSNPSTDGLVLLFIVHCSWGIMRVHKGSHKLSGKIIVIIILMDLFLVMLKC